MLKDKITVKHMELENRLVMPPMATHNAVDGKITDALYSYYEARTGAVGLIITEHAYVLKHGKASPDQISISKDADIDGLKKLVKVIHSKGNTKAVAQLNHAGMKIRPNVVNLPPIDVNTVTLEEIEELQKAFAYSAALAKSVGYDGVEIHAAHGYLLNQFYSPLTNHRDDEYSGSTLEGRTRFAVEVIRMVRETVGENYPILFRFGACDYKEGGSTIEEAPAAAKLFEDAGVDLLDISGGMNGYMISGHTEPGWFAPASKRIKEAVSIPVLVTGGITEASQAEELLKNGSADLIGVGRSIFKQADWAEKALGE